MSDQLEEARHVIRVNSHGVKTRRIKCRHGFRLSSDGMTCVPMTSSEKLAKRKAIKRAIRTKRAMGSGEQRSTTRKRLKALKKRRAMGIK